MEHLTQIVGRAWSTSPDETVIYINVAVGLNRNDIAHVAKKQQAEIEQLNSEIAALKESMHEEIAKLAIVVDALNKESAANNTVGQD